MSHLGPSTQFTLLTVIETDTCLILNHTINNLFHYTLYLSFFCQRNLFLSPYTTCMDKGVVIAVEEHFIRKFGIIRPYHNTTHICIKIRRDYCYICIVNYILHTIISLNVFLVQKCSQLFDTKFNSVISTVLISDITRPSM